MADNDTSEGLNPKRRLHFAGDYEEDVTAKDGTVITFRLIRPEDKSALTEGLNRMSPESRYARFFTARTSLSPGELSYLTEVDQNRHFAIVAGHRLPDGSYRGLGVARYICEEDDPRVAEAAVAVVDEAHGKGVGRMLFARLVAAAHERGVNAFTMDILADNDKMLGLLKRMFPGAYARPEDDAGVAILVVHCPLPHITYKDLHTERTSDLYFLFRNTASGMFRVIRRARAWPIPVDLLTDEATDDDDVPGAAEG